MKQKKFGSWLLNHEFWNQKWLQALQLLVAGIFFAGVIVTPLQLELQVLFATIVFIIGYVLNRISPGRLTTLVMISISAITSLRYMYWRVTETLGFENWIDAVFGYGLLLAELYALTVLMLSYFQSAWPLRRRPLKMPVDTSTWPSVDIYIPTYNEPLSVVRQTVLTAISQDWPASKLNIYVLDDGRRDEFREFCAAIGVSYLKRENNQHAKAGNINAALARTDGEFIAIFDCDHVPTRSFLQICMGWFIKDLQLAMLQTPHVFFSPDPLEQNLDIFRNVPNEGQLFYGLTQDGNDLWNATFFCGSCAVLRRTHLLQVGGIAVESVTEDALTALKMNRAGLNTAYLAVPQAAGLATESLSRHIGQRIRWARGMAQILRSHNPLLNKGLTLSQRVCYASAALHFFYGLPRLVFLTAPLAYLFAGVHVFQASALMIIAYAFPHILHAQLTNSRIQGKYRHSFWNEVYESVLAWYIMRPTLATLISPNSPSFNVTAKGGINTHAFFDWTLARPYIVLLALNVAGLLTGAWMIAAGNHDISILTTVAINMVWTFHNVVICSASVAVAGEQRQIRTSPRVAAILPATVGMQDGHRIACQTSDFSQEGLGILLPDALCLPIGTCVQVSLFRGKEERVFPASVVFSNGKRLGLRFQSLSLAQQVELAQMTFARADIWATSWNSSTPDSPWTAIRQIGRIGLRGFFVLMRESGREMGKLFGKEEAVARRTPEQS